MNTEQRQLLYDKLMEGVPQVPTCMLVEMADMITGDIDVIEPIIDGFLKEARESSAPTDWTMADCNIEIIPDGTSLIANVCVGPRKFCVHIDRTRMKSLGEFLVKESGM